MDNHVLISNPDDLSSKIQVSTSIDSLLDEFLRNNIRTCTHTHTCNPPSPSHETHTHTCYHTHTQVIPLDEEDDLTIERDRSVSKSRPSGNREAVRKYREKKKAHTAYLEEEVKKLQALNRQLMRKLQGQGVLEAEVLRLRGLLIDLRGKIDSELGLFPFQTRCNGLTGFKEGDCGVFVSSSNSGGNGRKSFPSSGGNCEASFIDCRANGKEMRGLESLMNSSSQDE